MALPKATMLLLLLALSACATLPGATTWTDIETRLAAPDALHYWLAVVEADAKQRERLWRKAWRDRQPWQIGLLQSVPGWRHHDVEAARRRLQATLNAYPSQDVAAVARLRLAQLAEQQQLRARIEQLQHRLDKIVAIERRSK